MVIRAAFVKARRREVADDHTVADEKNDAERLLDDPVSEIKNTESSKRDEAKKRE